MRAIDGYFAENIDATTAAFWLHGGLYGVDVAATFGGGSVKLQKVMGGGSSLVSVLSGTDSTAKGYATIDLPRGRLQARHRDGGLRECPAHTGRVRRWGRGRAGETNPLPGDLPSILYYRDRSCSAAKVRMRSSARARMRSSHTSTCSCSCKNFFLIRR